MNKEVEKRYSNRLTLLNISHAYFSGYMASEYSSKGIFSAKSDVLSFGSLLLEILRGKRKGQLQNMSYFTCQF
jgi:hypothetical protein